MKLKYDFEMVDIGEEIVAVPVGLGAKEIHGVLKLNKEGQKIFGLLKKETTEEEIITRIAEEYENDIATIREYIQAFLETLRNKNLLV